MLSTTCKLLMHVPERGTRGRALRTSTSYPEKPVVQPQGFGTRWLSPLYPTLSAAWESIAVISRFDSGIATAGAAAQPNLPQHNTNGVVQPDVCSPLDMGRTTTAVVLYHQHESLPKSVLNSLISLVQQKSGAERCNRSAPKRKTEYALHLLPTYTHAVISGSWMQ